MASLVYSQPLVYSQHNVNFTSCGTNIIPFAIFPQQNIKRFGGLAEGYNLSVDNQAVDFDSKRGIGNRFRIFLGNGKYIYGEFLENEKNKKFYSIMLNIKLMQGFGMIFVENNKFFSPHGGTDLRSKIYYFNLDKKYRWANDRKTTWRLPYFVEATHKRGGRRTSRKRGKTNKRSKK